MKALDEGNFTYGIFVDLQKAFTTTDHNILKKVDHYGVRGIANKWFEPNLTDSKQSALINALKNTLKAFDTFKNKQQKCMK